MKYENLLQLLFKKVVLLMTEHEELEEEYKKSGNREIFK